MIDFALMDRLKVLNFDEEFRRDIKMRPMSRYYFLVESNPSEQFHVFTSLATWLCRKCGVDLQSPLEDDDPNSTVSGILDATRQLGIQVDFSPNKLKQGFGEHVVYLLEKLSEKAVQSTDVSTKWRPLEIKSSSAGTGEGSDDDGEELGEEAEEDEDLENENGVVEEVEYSSGSDGENVDNLNAVNDNVEVDVAAHMADWKGEVERAAPSLRIRIIPSARDWRTHTQQLVAHRKELGQLSAAVGDSLQRASLRASTAVEAVRARQALLQERTAPALDRLARLRTQATTAVDSYKAASVGVTQRQEILSELTDKVENVKQKTEMKGSAMNDQSPIVNIKRAVTQLRKEIQDMDIQLAVLMWSVLEHQSRAKRNALSAQ